MLSIYHSDISDLSSRAHDGTFHATLGAVSRIKPPLENESSAFHAFVQMQSATLSLIKGLFRGSDIWTLSPDWDLSQPQGSEAFSKMSKEMLDLIEVRDARFIDIIQPTRAAVGADWLDDLRNDRLVRQWVHVVHRWRVPYQKEICGRRYWHLVQTRTPLFECERFRRPDVSHWGEDLIHVQQVLVTLLHGSWSEGLYNASFREVDFSELINSTLFVLKMKTKHAVAVEWYIQNIVEDFRKYLPRITESYGYLEPTLDQVQAAWEAKLIDIKHWVESYGGTALDFMEDCIWMFSREGDMTS
ncbi:hypothetical protein BXZ70DRAFT_952460 [Cristinia sonorae]|uniref:Uncharacterized protein n=1 Tax=Cristinia sonorae TaxID=1940300 RepID=A0A8K0UJR3_9AGAR|nr:hypothetical protein BXZ70DRAFT_952460 [Cristinia sonorae]